MPDLPTSASGKTAAQVARLCAQEAARVIMDAYGRVQDVKVKGPGNFVTQADMAAERATLDLLRQEYPEHQVLSEETAADVRGEGWMWVVDPLDGTHNFTRGIPHFAFNIALCHQREPLLGLTYAPATGDEYFAEAGGGLTVNGEPAHVSHAKRVKDSLLGIGKGYDDTAGERLLELAAELWPIEGMRDMGSAALGLAYAASGRFDVFIHHDLYPWDVAAGIVLVREGGGAIVDRDGGPVSIESRGAIAGARAAVDDMLSLVRGRPWRE
jgi:myo-inositol-1(or 4)-monophosphatase